MIHTLHCLHLLVVQATSHLLVLKLWLVYGRKVGAVTQKHEVVIVPTDRQNSGGAREANAPPIFFLTKNSFFWLPILRGANKKQKCLIYDHMGCVNTEKNENPAFKQIFPIFLTWLLSKLKFLIPMANIASPPSDIGQVMPMTTELARCHKSLYKSTAQQKRPLNKSYSPN